jgi:Zn-dependent M28 family amino/carboxypeptidase
MFFNKWGFVAASVCFMLQLQQCTNPDKAGTEDSTSSETKIVQRKYPAFSADTAFAFIKKQLDFGFRVPGTPAHKQCADWLFETLKSYCDTVYYQKSQARTADGKTIPVYNVVGSFKPKSQQRMLLGSHWDSRPWGDNDKERMDQPIPAANDGASGVAVLLELARNLKTTPPPSGVDIIFFDAEDMGKSEVENSFCLGSQLWAKTPHTPGYKAQFGILLDMVGGKDAQFYHEAYSAEKAGWVLSHVWALAAELGEGARFVNQRIGGITDDHVYVTEGSGIPMIDIIQYDPNGNGFASYWHTHNDNLESVDKNTLKSVGTVMHALVFNPPYDQIAQ